MKAFEEWLSEAYVYIADEHEITAEDAWKAALEWVLKKKIYSAPCKTPLDVLNAQIKKELENK